MNISKGSSLKKNRSKNRFYIFTIIAIFIIATLFMTSCKSGGSGNKGNSKNNKNVEKDKNSKSFSGKTITVLAADYMIPSESLREEFTEETGISVEYENVNWEQIPDALEVNKMEADLVEVDWTRLGLFKRTDLLDPIELSDEVIADMPSVKAFYYGKEIYAVPYFNDFTVIFYNTDQYSLAGIEDTSKTWDEVVEHSDKIMKSNVTRYPFSISLSDTSDTTMEFMTMTYTRNGKVFNENGTLNVESADDTLSYIDRIIKDEIVSPSSLWYYTFDNFRKIATGETSSLIGPASYIIGLNDGENSNVVGKVKLSKLPGKDIIFDNTVASPVGLGVMKSSKEKEAAKVYIDWFTSEEVQEKIYNESNIIPSRISALKKTIESNSIENSGDMLDIASKVEFPIPDNAKLFYKEIDQIMSYCINRMSIGELTKDESLSLMDSAISQVLAGNGIPSEIQRTIE